VVLISLVGHLGIRRRTGRLRCRHSLGGRCGLLLRGHPLGWDRLLRGDSLARSGSLLFLLAKHVSKKALAQGGLCG
jgi:hypothetical protein